MLVSPIAQYPELAPPQVQVTARYPGATAEVIANTVASPIEAQINGIDNLLYFNSVSSSSGNVTISVVFRPGIGPRHQPGERAEPREPGAVAAAAGRDAAGHHGGQEVLQPHDGVLGVFAGRPLQRDLHRQLREPLRAGRAEAGARRQPRLGVRAARHRDARVAAARPHGAARHLRAGRGERDPEPEPDLRHRADRLPAHARRRSADLRGHGAGPAHQARGVRGDHHPRGEGRHRDRAPARHRPRRARQARLLDREPHERQDRHHHRHLPAAGGERGGDRGRGARAAGRAEKAVSHRPRLQDRARHEPLHPELDRQGGAHLLRGRGAGRPGGLPVPPVAARDDHPDPRGAGLHRRHLHRHASPRLLDQHADALRHDPRHRAGGGRRHRRGRERRSEHDEARPRRRSRPRSGR